MDVEGELLKVMNGTELEDAVNEKIDKFHGFLTREVALKLIAKEKGLLEEEEKSIKLSEMTPEIRKAVLEVTVERIYPVADYRGGKKSRRILIKDDSAEKTLVLWNDDVDLTLKMRTGDVLELKGVYEKGDELYFGYSGVMKTKKRAEFSDISKIVEQEGQRVHLRGYISKISGFSEGMFVFRVSDEEHEVECRIVKDGNRGSALKEGDEIIIEGAFVRNGKVELEKHSRILTRRKEKMLIGMINKIHCRDNMMEVLVGKEKVLLDRENALRFMGLNAAEDINLDTLVTLKKDGLLNSNIHMKVTRKNERIIIG